MKSLLMFLLGAVAGAVLGAVFIARYHTVTPTEAAAPVSIIPRPTPEEALAPQSPATLPAEPAPAQSLSSPPAPPPAPAAVPSPAQSEPVAPSSAAPPAEPGVAVPASPGVATVLAPTAAVIASPARPGPLTMPIAGLSPRQLSDSFEERHSGQRHEAIDIMSPRGTPVLAVDDGRIAKLFTSKPGGLTIYHFDPAEKFAYYYAHLDRYAPGLAEGRTVKRGDVIGYVGSTGNASPNAPHLHFSVFALDAEKHWWQGTAINPYPLLTGG